MSDTKDSPKIETTSEISTTTVDIRGVDCVLIDSVTSPKLIRTTTSEPGVKKDK